MSYCGPRVLVSVRVHDWQDVDVHVVQDVGHVLVLDVKGHRLWGRGHFSARTLNVTRWKTSSRRRSIYSSKNTNSTLQKHWNVNKVVTFWLYASCFQHRDQIFYI